MSITANMRNIKLTVQYDGTNYSGWQSQKNGLTIQDVIENTARKVLRERTNLIVSGRTDAGVHAMGQVANFRTETLLPCGRIKNALNGNLPPDIRVAKIEDAAKNFHSQYDAKKKHYRYTMYAQKPVPPFYRSYVTHMPFKLDLELMKRESRPLLGRHDFFSFQGSNSRRKETTRIIYRIDIRKLGRFIYIDLEADGFLYNMARSIVGTLVDIGRGYLKEGSAKKILNAKNRRLAGYTVPAKGLCLMRVRY